MLHSQIIGDGFPVIALHGLYGSGDNLKILCQLNGQLNGQLDNSSRRFQFHFIDLPITVILPSKCP